MWRHAPLVLGALVAACSSGCADVPEGWSGLEEGVPALRKATPAKRVHRDPERVRPTPPADAWAYVLPVDYGVRKDRGGMGAFRAPRKHGQHNGIDLLAPVGTAVLAACDGEATGGESPSFGRFVHLVCAAPGTLSGARPVFGSLFYAHLDETRVPSAWTEVAAGDVLGAVGKSGNARDPVVMPHLHFELILHDSEEAAHGETHAGRDQADTEAAQWVSERLTQQCLAPNGVESHGALRRARRLDPFLTLMCFGAAKPALAPPPAGLGDASMPWSEQYRAAGFDVNEGLY